MEADSLPRLDDMGLDAWRGKTSSLFSDGLNAMVDGYVAWGVR